MPDKYSPLSEDQETVKEFDLRDYHDLPKDQKLAFLQAQLTELRNGVWRERVNVLHARRLQRDSDEAMSTKGNSNILEHKRMVRQFSGGIDTVKTLIEELEAEG